MKNDRTAYIDSCSGLNSLHGGFDGYDLRLWNLTAISKNSVTFSLLDPNGTEGFPGNQLTHVGVDITHSFQILFIFF